MNTALQSFLFPLHFLIFNFFFFSCGVEDWFQGLLSKDAASGLHPQQCLHGSFPSSEYNELWEETQKGLRTKCRGSEFWASDIVFLHYVMRRQGEWVLRVKFSFLGLIYLWKRSQRSCFSILPCEITQKKKRHCSWKLALIDLCVGTLNLFFPANKNPSRQDLCCKRK